jgi:hypothetical protein
MFVRFIGIESCQNPPTTGLGNQQKVHEVHEVHGDRLGHNPDPGLCWGHAHGAQSTSVPSSARSSS